MLHGTKLLFLFLFAGVVLSGCSNNPHPPPLHEKNPDGSPWMVSYRAISDDPRTLDPQVSYDTVGHSVIGLIYESPLQYHPFKTDPYELIPCLLESMPQKLDLKNGRQTYELKLKKGLFFHDDPCFPSTQGKGREVVAKDLAYVFKRIADPKVECPVLSTLQDYVIGLKEAYEAAKKNGAMDYSKALPGIEVVDRYSLRIHLMKPYPQILYWLAMPFTAPVPFEAVEYYDGKVHENIHRKQFKFHPVGTGAFFMAEWRKKQVIRLVRFPRYCATTFPTEGWTASNETRFRPLAEKSIPFLDEIQISIIPETIPRWLLFRQGYLEAAAVNKDVFDTVLNISHELTPEYQRRGVQLHKNAEPSTFYLIFNMEDAIVGKNKKLRQAISIAYDEDLSIEIFSNNVDINAQQLLPPGVFGFQPEFRNPYKKNDMVLAKRLMTEAGYPNGQNPKTGSPLELALDVTGDSASTRQLSEFEKRQLEKLGIHVKIIENTWARLQEKVDKGNFQITSYGWHADYPDPENFFFLFYGRNLAPQGNNYPRYQNPEFDQIFEKMSTMDNTPERLKLVYQLNDILVEDVPVVFLNHDVLVSLNQIWAPRVSSNSLMANGSKYVFLDVQLRKEKQRKWNQKPVWPLYILGGLLVGAIGFGICWNRRQHV